jgi:hypothetical protein
LPFLMDWIMRYSAFDRPYHCFWHFHCRQWPGVLGFGKWIRGWISLFQS